MINCIEKLKSMAKVAPHYDNHHMVVDDNLAIEREFGEMLMDAVKESKAKTIVEVGTGTGYSTSWILIGAIGNKGQVYTFDKEARPPFRWDQAGIPTDNLKVFNIDFSSVNGELPKKIDFVFHDSQHFFELIKADLDILIPRISDGGQIWIHDVRDELNDRLSEFFNEIGWSYKNHSVACGISQAVKPGGE